MSGLALPQAMAAAPRAVARPVVVGPLALSLLGHVALLAAGLAASLLIPVAPPLAPAFSVELAIMPADSVAPGAAELADAAPLPVPPPEAMVVPRAAELAAVLAEPEAAPAPDMAPPRPEPPPVPPRPMRAHPAHPAPSHPASSHPAPTRVAVTRPGPPQPEAAPPPAATAPVLIASPRFRQPPRPPVYPRRAVELRAQGEVLVGALLDLSGTPHDLRVLRSSGHAMLDRAALEAVGGWAFEPGRRGGQPVAARVEIPVRFTLR